MLLNDGNYINCFLCFPLLFQNITSVTMASLGLKIGDRVLVGGTKVLKIALEFQQFEHAVEAKHSHNHKYSIVLRILQ